MYCKSITSSTRHDLWVVHEAGVRADAAPRGTDGPDPVLGADFVGKEVMPPPWPCRRSAPREAPSSSAPPPPHRRRVRLRPTICCCRRRAERRRATVVPPPLIRRRWWPMRRGAGGREKARQRHASDGGRCGMRRTAIGSREKCPVMMACRSINPIALSILFRSCVRVGVRRRASHDNIWSKY